MSDCAEMRGQVRHGVDEIAFEPVDCFDGDRDPMFASDLAGGPMEVDRALALVRRRRLAGEVSERGVERTAKDLRAQGRGTLDDPVDMLQSRRALFRRRANRIHVQAWKDGSTRRFEAETLETAAKLGVLSGRALEHRYFDAVIANALDVLENGPMFGLNVRCPQQQAEPDLHPVPSRKFLKPSRSSSARRTPAQSPRRKPTMRPAVADR